MSLINDVLKDLEARQARSPDAAAGASSTRAPAPVSRHRRWPLWLLAAVAAGVVLHLSLDSADRSKAGDASAPLVAQAESRPAEPAAPAGHQQQAKPATVPLRAVPSRPSDSPLAAASDGEEFGVSAAVPDSGESGRAQEAPREAAPAGEPADSPAPTEAAAATRQAATPRSPAEDNPATVPAAQSETPSQEEPTISIRRSGTDDAAADPLAAAKRLLARGQVQRAESRLRQLVAQKPGLGEAHELLASTLIRRGRYEAAIPVLENGLSQANESAPLAALLGRLLIERGEVARARSILEAHVPPLTEAPDYHLLLAAVHRQAGDHEQAAAHYRNLSEVLPRNGAVWIGLGASLESLERPHEAASAYNRALDSGDERAARFARGRLAALEKITGEPQ